MDNIDFKDKVAIVTGAGGGLGRFYALELARRGAKVCVNDFGGSRDGTAAGSSPLAQLIVDEIEQAGGSAMPHGASVSDKDQVAEMVEQVVAKWGRIDILINNAGILRDKTFAKCPLEDFEAVVQVHLMGSIICTKAVWDVMREQNYGRIIMTTSSTGLYGNFGQANYAAAKMGLVGLTRTLMLEGAKYNIHTNAVAPIAYTRMTEDLMNEEAAQQLAPNLVTPGVIFMCSDSAPNGAILSAGMNCYSLAHVVETEGVYLPGEANTVEGVAAAWSNISDENQGLTIMQTGMQGAKMAKLIEKSS